MTDEDNEKILRALEPGAEIVIKGGSTAHQFVSGNQYYIRKEYKGVKVEDGPALMTIKLDKKIYHFEYTTITCKAIEIADQIFPNEWQKEFERKKSFYSH